MSEQELTEDEQELLRLLKDLMMFGFTLDTAQEEVAAILAHYREAKAEAVHKPRIEKEKI